MSLQIVPILKQNKSVSIFINSSPWQSEFNDQHPGHPLKKERQKPNFCYFLSRHLRVKK
nr:MAG TPA: hypothetical protein [Bacteriophage sp.]